MDIWRVSLVLLQHFVRQNFNTCVSIETTDRHTIRHASGHAELEKHTDAFLKESRYERK